MWLRIASLVKTIAVRLMASMCRPDGGGEIIETAGERVLGRVTLEEIRDPFTGEVLIQANQGD